MAITYNKFNELAKLVLSSPQGLFAVVAVITSTIALIYLFLSRSTQSSSSKSSSRSKSGSAKSSPAKQSPIKRSSPKKSTSSPKKETPSKAASTAVASNKTTTNKSSSDKKGLASAEKKAGASTKTSSKSRQSNGLSKTSQNKDDGEWITVNSKKKILRPKKVVEATSVPQTRMSTRRSNQNSQTPKRV